MASNDPGNTFRTIDVPGTLLKALQTFASVVCSNSMYAQFTLDKTAAQRGPVTTQGHAELVNLTVCSRVYANLENRSRL